MANSCYDVIGDNSDSCVSSCCNNSKRADLRTRTLSFVLCLPLIVSIFFMSYALMCVICAFLMFMLARELTLVKKKNEFFLLRLTTFSIAACGLCAFTYCRGKYGVNCCLFLVIIASFTDIGAYCVGSLLKGPKLCPKISPNKTWAGLLGGFLFANIAYFVLGNLFFFKIDSWVFFKSPALNICFVQFMIISAVCGDLLESLFKRKMNVKDISNFLPGHGGFLDRLDSLIFMSIVFVLLSIICNNQFLG